MSEPVLVIKRGYRSEEHRLLAQALERQRSREERDKQRRAEAEQRRNTVEEKVRQKFHEVWPHSPHGQQNAQWQYHAAERWWTTSNGGRYMQEFIHALMGGLPQLDAPTCVCPKCENSPYSGSNPGGKIKNWQVELLDAMKASSTTITTGWSGFNVTFEES